MLNYIALMNHFGCEQADIVRTNDGFFDADNLLWVTVEVNGGAYDVFFSGRELVQVWNARTGKLIKG